MFRRITHLPLAAFLSTVLCAVGQAVAVPPELIKNEAPVPYETLYGFIVVVFVVGIALGIWVQKKLGEHTRVLREDPNDGHSVR